MAKTLKEIHEDLESKLYRKTDINFKDKTNNVWNNLKRNKEGLITSFIAASVLGVSVICGMSAYKEDQKVQNYEYARDYVVAMEEYVGAAADSGNKTPISIQDLSIPYKLVAENSKTIYQEEGKEILNFIDETKKVLERSDNPKDILPYLDKLEDDLDSLDDTWTGLGYLVGCGIMGFLGAFTGLMGGAVLTTEADWHSEIKPKKRLKKTLDKDMENIRTKLESNPNAEKIYRLANRLDGTLNDEAIVDVLKEFSYKKDQIYGPLIEMIMIDYKDHTYINSIIRKVEDYEEELANKKP